MLSTVLLPWFHYVAVLLMAGAAVAEMYLLRLTATQETVRLLPRVDILYGLTAVIVLVTGLLRVWFGGKGSDWYWSNGLFHGVLTVFLILFLVSLVPTFRFIRWRKALNTSSALPHANELRRMKLLVHAQLGFITVIALLITFVAKGYGAK